MQKHMLLLLLIVNQFGICAMEDNSSSLFSSLRSYLPTWLVGKSVSLSPMQEAQASKDNFEMKLNTWTPNHLRSMHKNLHELDIDANPIEALKYCYYSESDGEHHNKFNCTIHVERKYSSLLNQYKKIRVDGYSALGAAIISKYKHARPFTEELLWKNFILTEKDKTLIGLELYNDIPAEKRQMMISLLHGQQKNNLALLPHDVRRSIVDYMVCLYKAENWFCSLLR